MKRNCHGETYDNLSKSQCSCEEDWQGVSQPVLQVDWHKVQVSKLWHGTSAWRLSAAGVLMLLRDLTSILKPSLFASHPSGLPRCAHSLPASWFTGKLRSNCRAPICKSETHTHTKWELVGRLWRLCLPAIWQSYLVSAMVEHFWCRQNTDC